MGIKIEKDTRFLKIRYAIAFKRISRTEHEKCTNDMTKVRSRKRHTRILLTTGDGNGPSWTMN